MKTKQTTPSLILQSHPKIDTSVIKISICLTMIIMCILLLPCKTWGSTNIPDKTSKLLKTASGKLDSLEKLCDKAKHENITTVYADVTITTAKIMLKYVNWDITHKEQLADIISKKTSKIPDEKKEYVAKHSQELAISFPQQELKETIGIIDFACRELKKNISSKKSKRAPQSYSFSNMNLHDGYFRVNGQPVFPSTIIRLPLNKDLMSAYGSARTFSSFFGNLNSDLKASITTSPWKNIVNLGTGYLFTLFVASNKIPKQSWMNKFPGIRDGHRPHMSVDIDNPLIRTWTRIWLEQTAEAYSKKSHFTHMYELQNEPYIATAEDGWEAENGISKYTKAKFHQWLRNHYKTISALNKIWNKKFKSFSDVSINMPISRKLRGGAIWYDWCSFNQDRLTSWFKLLVNSVHEADPHALGLLKVSNLLLNTDRKANGLNFEAIDRVVDATDIHSGFRPANFAKDKQGQTLAGKQDFSITWPDVLARLDFATSISPNKLTMDLEDHSMDYAWTITNPEKQRRYVKCTLWLQYIRGIGANSMWYWGRYSNGAPRRYTQFYGSMVTQPVVLDEFGRTMKVLDIYGKKLAELANAPKQVWIFYTEASALQDTEYLKEVRKIYTALNLADYRVGFVTPTMLENQQTTATQHKYQNSEYKYMVLPKTKYLSNKALPLLKKQLKMGTKAVLVSDVPDEYSLDAHGQKRDNSVLKFLDSISRVNSSRLGRKLVKPLNNALFALGLKQAVRCDYAPNKNPNKHWKTPAVLMRYVKKDGNFLVALVNVGTSKVIVKLTGLQSNPAKNLLDNQSIDINSIALKPYDVKLLKVAP